jgi:hypothetical protein
MGAKSRPLRLIESVARLCPFDAFFSCAVRVLSYRRPRAQRGALTVFGFEVGEEVLA